jgi:hypothetical protein
VYGLLRNKPLLDDVELRSIFRLRSDAEIILVSVATDPELEGLYRDFRWRDVPLALSRLRVLHITAPNFSFPLSLPRTESLTNRSRIVKVSEQLAASGLSVIPHLNATDQSDFRYWADFLRDRPEIQLVAKEFQTGLKSRPIVRWHVAQLMWVQEYIGRKLRLIAVGGRGMIPELRGLESLTIIDSTPFIKAANRQIMQTSTSGKKTWTLVRTRHGEPFDDHLGLNIARYRDAVLESLATIQGQSATVRQIPDKSPVSQRPSRLDDQLELWPDMRLQNIA